MSKPSRKGKDQRVARRITSTTTTPADFDEDLSLIDVARTRAVAAVNTALIELYWTIGEYISRKIAQEGWGQGTVEALAEYIRKRQPAAGGFSASNLWRMMQFFETYRDQPKLATLLRELSWSHNLAIMSRCKRDEERKFYLRMATREQLKIEEFQPEHLGKLEFYLEALDRDVKKPHERPSIGVLLCATKDHEVVEYALSRVVSPALVAEYQTRLPEKKLLQAKLHEFYELAQQQATLPAPGLTIQKPKAKNKKRK